MIEKLGHKKRLQIMRKEWINEGKLKDKSDDVELASKTLERYQPSISSMQHLVSGHNPTERTQTSVNDDWTDNDLSGPQKPSGEANKKQSQVEPADSLFISDNEAGNDALPEDELDALLAEDETKAKNPKNVPQRQDNGGGQMDDNFEDALEVMAGLEDIW